MAGRDAEEGFGGTKGQLRHRGGGGGGGGSLGRLPAFANHRKLAAAADAVDAWGLWMGLYLRNNAYARLYFLVYVLLLHSWVFLVVSFRVHSFEQVHGDHFTAGGGYSAGGPLSPSGLLSPSGSLSAQPEESLHALLQPPTQPLAQRDPTALGPH